MRYKLLAPLALAFAATLSAQTVPTVPLEFELGYRWVDVTGNEQMYRTQINDRPGVLLRSLNFASNAPIDGALDYLRIDASDIGAGPAGAFRLSAGQQNLFRLNFSWRRTNLYSALPAFANPFLEDGIVPGQQTYNRTRNIYDVGLELFPGKMFTPILGYTRNVYGGPGKTTYHLGADEFALNDDVKAVDDEYRIGLRVDAGPVQGAVIQGWRRYHYNDASTLVPGAGGGNNTGPVLGQTEVADSISRTTETQINTPATSAWITGQLFSRVKLIGSYIRSDASADTSSLEGDLGNFVSFRISRFFSGLDEPITSTATTDYWRGSARAEIQLAPGIELAGGWMQKSRQLTGSALAASLYLDTVTFGGVSEGDLLRIIESNTSLDRDDTTFDVTASAVRLGPFSVNAGWSQTKQEVTFGSEFSSLVIPGEPAGEYERTVNTYGAGMTFSKFGVTLGADYRRDEADQPILRTDFINRDRYKVRAQWAWKSWFKIGATWQENHGNDDAPEIQYSTKIRELVADLELTLWKDMLTFHASGGEFKANRNILIRVPQNFDIVPTAQRELGHTWDGGLTFAWKGLNLDATYMWMENDGSIPFTINRIRSRAEYFVTEHVGIAGEWLWDKYGESPAFDQAGTLANYNANRYYVGFHWRP